MDNSTQNEQIEMKALSENEIALGTLYSKFANLFPEDKSFWMGITKDEMLHGSWITELSTMVEQGSVVMEAERFKLAAIQQFSEYINEQIKITETESISAIKALSISMDLERSLLESDIFKVYDTDDVATSDILDRLTKSTEEHFQQVQNRWTQEKNDFSPR